MHGLQREFARSLSRCFAYIQSDRCCQCYPFIRFRTSPRDFDKNRVNGQTNVYFILFSLSSSISSIFISLSLFLSLSTSLSISLEDRPSPRGDEQGTTGAGSRPTCSSSVLQSPWIFSNSNSLSSLHRFVRFDGYINFVFHLYLSIYISIYLSIYLSPFLLQLELVQH